MTRFMEHVEEVLGGRPAPGLSTRPTRVLPVAIVTDRQASLRALAEQLVGEANAVMAGTGESLQLIDEVTDGRLCFTLRCGARAVRVQATVAGHHGMAEIILDGQGEYGPSELAGDEDLERLILSLVGSQSRPSAE